MRYVVSGTLLVALAGSACSPSDDTGAGGSAAGADTAAVATASPYVRGIAIRGTTPRFVVCGTTDTLRLIDASGTMPASGGDSELTEIFAIVTGSFHGDTVTVERVVYASADRGECYNDWTGFDYRATGNNPGWVAEVRGTDVRLRLQGDVNFEFSDVRKDSTDGLLRFTAPAGAETGAFEMVFESRPCTDVAARTLSMFSARVRVGDRQLRGCAVPGR